ncbi:MAG: hypothetical protein NC452_02230 [Eubacterium sp.]|nr:hypothetical protein [Eubacterium sp.]
MLDILLDKNGDIHLSPAGDISTTESVRQAILIRLRWIFAEWRLGPEYGFPWFEEVFVKNPNTEKIRLLIRDKIMSVTNVKEADVSKVVFDKAKRTATVKYSCKIGEEIFEEELIFNE